MPKGDAEVKVDADATAVERAAAVAIDAWRNAGSSISGALAGVSRGLADVALHSGQINFASQHEQVKAFEGATAHLGIAMGRSLETVRSELEATGVSIGKRPSEVAAWTKEVGSLTYNFNGAEKAMKGMAGLAAMTGRNVEDYRGLAVELGSVGKVAGDTTHVIGVLASQAKALGTKGGVAAFTDQIGTLGEVISHFAINSEKDFLKVTALAGALGKGLDPEAQKRVAQGAFGAIAGDPIRWSRYLHRDILNKKTGQVDNPADVMQQVTEKIKRQWHGEDALRVLRLNFGAETGTAMYNADFKGAAKLAGIGASGAPQAALDAFKKTDAGKRDVAEAHLAESSRALMGSSTLLGKAADSLEHFASSSPLAGIASTLAATAAGGALSGGLGKVAGKGVGYAAGKFGDAVGIGEKTTALGSVGRIAKGLGAVALAGGLGYEVGTLADEAFGISDWISGTGKKAGWTGDQGADAEAARRKSAATQTGMALRKSGLSGEDLGAAYNATAALNVKGQPITAEALAAQLGKTGTSQEDAQRIAKAVTEALKQVKFTMINATGGPADVVNESGESAAAGSQWQ